MAQEQDSADTMSEFSAKAPTAPPTQRPKPLHLVARTLAIGAAAVVVLFAGLVFTKNMQLGAIDDAYISLRYATHWAGGEGLVFNFGERVEGYTNFLWIVLEAALIRTGAHPERAMLILGWFSLTLLTATFTWFLMSEPLNLDPKCAIVYGALLCVNPIMLCWAVSGMETCCYTWLLFLSAALALKSHTTALRLSAIVLILAAVTRPEAVVMAPLLAIVVWLRNASPKRGITYVLIFAVGYGAYFTWRALHFEQFLPNTFYAKLDYSSMLLAKRGLLYVWDFAVAIPLFVFLAAWSIRYRAGRGTHVVPFLAIVLLHAAVVTYEGGDHFAMYRFMVPVMPFLGALVLQLVARHRRLWTHAVCILAFASASYTASAIVKRNDMGYTQLSRFQLESELSREWQDMGTWFKHNVPAQTTLCTIAIGSVGFHSGLQIIEPHGLIDPYIGAKKVTLGRGYSGHEKYDVEYILNRAPDLIMLYNRLSEEPLSASDQSGVLWGAFNNAMFDNPRLNHDYHFENHDTGAGFINVYVRKSFRKAE